MALRNGKKAAPIETIPRKIMAIATTGNLVLDSVGVEVGEGVGSVVSEARTSGEGSRVGLAVGFTVGFGVGDLVGEGVEVGEEVGLFVGEIVDNCDGVGVGFDEFFVNEPVTIQFSLPSGLLAVLCDESTFP